MTEDELKQEIKAIDDECNKLKSAVCIKYALANNPYKIGDIIEDHYKRIKIEKIKACKHGYYPECLYYGIRLSKLNNPCKNQSDNCIYQGNVKRKL